MHPQIDLYFFNFYKHIKMNSDHSNIHNLFTLVIHTILTKISIDYQISISDLTIKIGNPTINTNDDLETSIRAYCDTLIIPIIPPSPIENKSIKIIKKKTVLEKMNASTEASVTNETIFEQPIFTNQSVLEPVKQKKIIKKKVAEVPVAIPQTPVESETTVTPVETLVETLVEPPKQKKIIKKKVVEAPQTPVESETTVTPLETLVEPPKQKKIIKKKVAEVPVAIPQTPVESETNVTPVETLVEPPKQKKIIKKKVVEVPVAIPQTPVESEAPQTPVESKTTVTPVEEVVESAKQKKIIKKKISEPLVETPVEVVKTIHMEEVDEVKIKPKKNEPFVKKNIENTDSPEYGEEVDNPEIYESLQIYDTDDLEPKKINDTNYYVDTSGYVYDFESQELVGKLNQSGDSVIFLSDFSQ